MAILHFDHRIFCFFSSLYSVSIIMPSFEEYFKEIPPFPADVPIADIPTISYSNLKSDSKHDSENLFEACKEQGFFLLDLRGHEEGERLLKDAEMMFDLNVALFDLGNEALLKYKANIPRDLNGYVLSKFTIPQLYIQADEIWLLLLVIKHPDCLRLRAANLILWRCIL